VGISWKFDPAIRLSHAMRGSPCQYSYEHSLENSYSGAPPVLFNFITPNAGKEGDPSFYAENALPCFGNYEGVPIIVCSCYS
jgi:hypothetical protein